VQSTKIPENLEDLIFSRKPLQIITKTENSKIAVQE
jgi:hypothetical protein